MEDGRAGYRALGRDVTLLEKVQKDLQLARQTIEGVIEGTPLAIFVLNRNHRVAYWNRACEVLTGVSKDRILGTRDHALALYRERRETMADLLLRGDLDRLHALYRDKKLVRSPWSRAGTQPRIFSLISPAAARTSISPPPRSGTSPAGCGSWSRFCSI